VATAAFDGKDWMEQAFLDAPTPHTGLAAMLDAQPLSDDLLKLAPADSANVMAGTFDLAKFVATIRASVAQVDPEAGQMVEKVIGAVSLYVGRDFQKDVLEPLGEHWLCYSSPTIAGRGLLGSVIVNQLNDPKKAESGILATQIATFNTISPFLARYQITLRGQNLKAGDLSINYIAVPLVSPAWCVKGQNLYVSLYPQNIISADRFAQSGGKSILDNPNFTALRQRLGAPSKITGVSYTDLTQTVGEGYQSAVALSRLVLGVGDIFGVRSPEPVVPPLDVLMKHVGPSGGVSWVDETGWHSKAVSSFPGADLFSGGSEGAVTLIGRLYPLLGAFGSMAGPRPMVMQQAAPPMQHWAAPAAPVVPAAPVAPQMDFGAKKTAAHAQLQSLETALEAYEIDNGSYPTSQQGLSALLKGPAGLKTWHGPYVKTLPNDPWGRPFVYRNPGTHNHDSFDLISRGADGKLGTADDVANSESK
jgi:type II secretion system protein G